MQLQHSPDSVSSSSPQGLFLVLDRGTGWSENCCLSLSHSSSSALLSVSLQIEGSPQQSTWWTGTGQLVHTSLCLTCLSSGQLDTPTAWSGMGAPAAADPDFTPSLRGQHLRCSEKKNYLVLYSCNRHFVSFTSELWAKRSCLLQLPAVFLLHHCQLGWHHPLFQVLTNPRDQG